MCPDFLALVAVSPQVSVDFEYTITTLLSLKATRLQSDEIFIQNSPVFSVFFVRLPMEEEVTRHESLVKRIEKL